jgi:hypothetical protein
MTSISNFGLQAPAFAGVVGKPNLTIASESPADSRAWERLLDAAFGAARSDKTPERLREGRLPAPGLALAAKDAGDLVGTLRMWHILAGEVSALLLGPLAVAKAYRSRVDLAEASWLKLCSERRAWGTKPSCSSATRLIMNPSAFPAAIRLRLLFPAPSMKRAFSARTQRRCLARGARLRGRRRRARSSGVSWGDRVPPPAVLSGPAGLLDSVEASRSRWKLAAPSHMGMFESRGARFSGA